MYEQQGYNWEFCRLILKTIFIFFLLNLQAYSEVRPTKFNRAGKRD